MTLEYHEAANIFPLDEEHFDEFAEDIRCRGLIVPIRTLDGKIIDGRRRYLACQKTGVKPKFSAVITADPIGYVVSLNLHRRHLTEPQRAMVAAKIANMAVGNPDLSIHSDDRIGAVSIPDAAKMMNVSVASVGRAKQVIRDAAHEVVDAIERGELPIYTACKIAKLPKEDQLVALEERKAKKLSGGKNTPGPTANGQQNNQPQPEPGVGNGAVKVNLQRQKAFKAAADVIDYLLRSPLIGIGRKNPHRDAAFDKVIRWLRTTKKRTSNGD